MRESFSKLQDVDATKLEVVMVENIAAEGAFDEAVKGVQAIMHLAAPFHFGAKKASGKCGCAMRLGRLSNLVSLCRLHQPKRKRHSQPT